MAEVDLGHVFAVVEGPVDGRPAVTQLGQPHLLLQAPCHLDKEDITLGNLYIQLLRAPTVQCGMCISAKKKLQCSIDFK